jgi:CheY-like chemotaxis protein
MANILVACEDEAGSHILHAELAALGHRVFMAATGRDAMEAALKEDADAAFLSATLPIFDGYETCRLMRDDPDFAPGLPIVIVSGEPRDARRLERCGASGFLSSRHESWELAEMLSPWLIRGH